MDDPRLSGMYARAIAREASSLRRRLKAWANRHRSALRSLVGVLCLLALGLGYYAHLRGKFRRLKTELNTPRQVPGEPALLVGGQEPLTLERAPLSDNSMPELLSATLLPGRGMAVLQLTASIPGRGVVSLLDSGSLEEAARLLGDPAADPDGTATARLTSPVNAPWAGAIYGSAQSDAGRRIQAEWRGHSMDLPLTGPEESSSDGLLLHLASEAVEHNIMPDGGSTKAEYDAHDFGAGWPSQTHLTVTAQLSSRAFDLRVSARNLGKEPEPLGIGWVPRFVLPSGSLTGATLHLPADQLEEMRNGRATGRLTDVGGTSLDYTARTGRRLSGGVDATFAHLKTGFLDNGPVLELRDVDSGTGFRMSALSPQIRAVRLATSSKPGVISIGFQTNYDDPFSRVWPNADSGGMILLDPGQTVQWHVRLELYSFNSDPSTPL